MLWLMTVIAGGFVSGNRADGRGKLSRQQVRDAMVYVAAASVLVAVFSAVMVHDVINGVHRNIKENWVIAVVTAVIVCSYAIKDFWSVRRFLGLWAVLACYLAVHFSVLVPALGRMERIPSIYIWPISMGELMALTFILSAITPNARSEAR